ncbi:hypothetical protein G1K90_11830, partial [Tenacibaculum finnmarkense]|nr:hypothetical protein [Tenacibaculum finnmarkense]
MQQTNYFIRYIFILNVFFTCGQSKKEDVKESKMYDITKFIDQEIKEITANNIIEKIQEQVKGYPQEPMYLLRINQEYCTYEVLVNDFPVYENYALGVNATGIKINRAILKSDEQTVTLRMYPIGDLEQEAYGDDMPYYKTLKGGSSMRIEVIRIPDWKNYDIAGEEI